MTVTSASLVRTAGAAAIAAGAIFIGVQINHPHLDVASITTTEVMIRNALKTAMAALALTGITGMYLSHVRRNGVPGLIGYLVLATSYLLILCTTFMAAFVLPNVAGTDPAFVGDVIAIATGGTATGPVGAVALLWQIQNLTYLAGNLVFGIALFRARVLARWATTLLAFGGVVSIALSVLPDPFYRLLAFPNGIAMIGLGYSLWRFARRVVDQVPDTAVLRPRQTSV
jgi:hypothetical protein